MCYDKNGVVEMKWKLLIALMVLILSFTIFLSRTAVYFSDDGGGTNDTSSKNPQTAVVGNVRQQEMLVELQKMAVIVTKNA